MHAYRRWKYLISMQSTRMQSTIGIVKLNANRNIMLLWAVALRNKILGSRVTISKLTRWMWDHIWLSLITNGKAISLSKIMNTSSGQNHKVTDLCQHPSLEFCNLHPDIATGKTHLCILVQAGSKKATLMRNSKPKLSGQADVNSGIKKNSLKLSRHSSRLCSTQLVWSPL